jgi:hypothetical protein
MDDDDVNDDAAALPAVCKLLLQATISRTPYQLLQP